MITTAKALGAGFPVCGAADGRSRRAVSQDRRPRHDVRRRADGLRDRSRRSSTSSNRRSLLANVRQRSAQIRETCIVGPGRRRRRARLAARPAHVAAREGRAARAAEARHPRPAPARDPNVVRILAPFVLEAASTSTQLRDALAGDLAIHEPLPRSGRLPARADRRSARARRSACRSTRSRRRSPARCSGLLFLNPSLRTLASFQAAMMRLGGTSFVITPGQGTWQIETRTGAIMNGAAAEHVREAMPVLASYCDALGIRMFAEGRNLAADLAETSFTHDGGPVRQAARQHGVGDEPSVPGARRLEDAGRAAACRERGKFVLSWVNHPRALPLAVPAATVHMAAHARHGSRRAAPRGLRAAGRDHGEGARRRRKRPAARSPRRPIATRRSPARTCSTPRNGARRSTTATTKPRRGCAQYSATGA